MEPLAAICGLALAIAVLVCAWLSCPRLGIVLMAGFVVRIMAVAFHNFIAPLPDSQADALVFHNQALSYVPLGIKGLVVNFPGMGAYLYSWGLGWVYLAIGPSEILGQCINVAAGLLVILCSFRITELLWGPNVALPAAAIVALYPTSILYSSLTMRESIIIMIYLYGILAVVRYLVLKPRVVYLLIAAVLFTLAGMFHSGMLLATPIMLFVMAVLAPALRRTEAVKPGGGVRILVVACALVALIVYAAISGVLFPKFGELSELGDTEVILRHGERSARGVATYPNWLVADSSAATAYLMPAKVVYFLFGPFPWEVTRSHLWIGVADATGYILLFLLIVKNTSHLRRNGAGLVLAAFALLMISVFAAGTGNYGTAMRHRAKFLPLLAILAVPLGRRISSSNARPMLPSATN
jgi:hypothetical protein